MPSAPATLQRGGPRREQRAPEEEGCGSQCGVGRDGLRWRALDTGSEKRAVGGVAESGESPGRAVIGCDRAEGGVEEGGTELRGDVALAGAGLGHRACDAAAAAELGINGKSFGRSGRIVRSLRDGGGGAGGGQDRVERGRGHARGTHTEASAH
ncbi:hypothetical protein GHT09_016364 [Marmota monax]|uniref:Uncharacterized protein n=1 Tax=Marmota monax TaxID=9995 RepID=A0A834Q5A7_MARMO|nr:hypothetical protein GHT09_016364 [Marmota monax]